VHGQVGNRSITSAAEETPQKVNGTVIVRHSALNKAASRLGRFLPARAKMADLKSLDEGRPGSCRLWTRL
jgi:hypothetical protein